MGFYRQVYDHLTKRTWKTRTTEIHTSERKMISTQMTENHAGPKYEQITENLANAE